MDMRLRLITYGDLSWDVFRSEMFHHLKWNTIPSFLSNIEANDVIGILWDRKKYAEAFYVLALYDYYSANTRQCKPDPRYTYIREQRLQNTMFPLEVLMLDTIRGSDSEKEKMLALCKNNEMSRCFLHYNIAEILDEKELFHEYPPKE